MLSTPPATSMAPSPQAASPNFCSGGRFGVTSGAFACFSTERRRIKKTVFLGFSKVFLWFSKVFLGFSKVFLGSFKGVPRVFKGFPMVFEGFPRVFKGFPRVFQGCS